MPRSRACACADENYARDARQLREIGRGDLDFGAIVDTARAAGAAWLIYELDASSIGDSLASACESAAVLRPLVFCSPPGFDQQFPIWPLFIDIGVLGEPALPCGLTICGVFRLGISERAVFLVPGHIENCRICGGRGLCRIPRF